MKRYQELTIDLNGFKIENLIDLLKQQCDHCNWKYDLGHDELNRYSKMKIYCFLHQEEDKKNGLYINSKKFEEDIWYVSNIVPIEGGLCSLSQAEYNWLLNDFQESVLKRAVLDLPVEVELSKDEIFIEQVMGNEVAEALKNFSDAANKATGSSHPNDKERWFQFLESVNKTGITLRHDLLKGTLLEQGWSEEYADELVGEFSFAQDLLSHAMGE